MVQSSKTIAKDTVTLPRKEYENLQFKLAEYEQQIGWLKRMIFGRKSERFVPTDSAQITLDIEAPEQAVAQPEKPKEHISYEREKPASKKNKAVRTPIPDHLPRQKETIEPADIPEGSKKIGEEITEILEMAPGKIYVRQIIRPKYGLPQDEGVVIGQLPSLPIPKGNAGPSLLAHILISKYTDHLPFYRQRQQYKRMGVELSESTIGGWFSASCQLLEPLYNRLRKRVLEADYLQADETPIPVLTSQKPSATHKGYHWVYHWPVEKLVMFDYRNSRSREGPAEILKDYKGALQTDGYAAYDGFENKEGFQLLACMAHARRKFIDAKANDSERGENALAQIQQLYDIERQAREWKLNSDERKLVRQVEAAPLVKQLESWLKAQLSEVLPKSAIGQAIQYTLKLWPRLRRYIDDGRWEIDNNLIENTIRPVALGRKNYLFAGSHEAAQRAAMVYSLLGTCKLNGTEPLAWLDDVFTRLPEHPVNRLDELLPPYWQPAVGQQV